MNAANFVWFGVACLCFTSITCIGVAWAAVAMAKDYSAKLVEGLRNRTNILAGMPPTIEPDGRETNGRSQHRVVPTEYQRAASTEAR